jgi:hypothetical protein
LISIIFRAKQKSSERSNQQKIVCGGSDADDDRQGEAVDDLTGENEPVLTLIATKDFQNTCSPL